MITMKMTRKWTRIFTWIAGNKQKTSLTSNTHTGNMPFTIKLYYREIFRRSHLNLLIDTSITGRRRRTESTRCIWTKTWRETRTLTGLSPSGWVEYWVGAEKHFGLIIIWEVSFPFNQLLLSISWFLSQGPHIYVSEEMRPLKATPETLTHHCNYYYFGNVTRIAAEQTVKNFIRERFLDQVGFLFSLMCVCEVGLNSAPPS